MMIKTIIWLLLIVSAYWVTFLIVHGASEVFVYAFMKVSMIKGNMMHHRWISDFFDLLVWLLLFLTYFIVTPLYLSGRSLRQSLLMSKHHLQGKRLQIISLFLKIGFCIALALWLSYIILMTWGVLFNIPLPVLPIDYCFIIGFASCLMVCAFLKLFLFETMSRHSEALRQ